MNPELCQQKKQFTCTLHLIKLIWLLCFCTHKQLAFFKVVLFKFSLTGTNIFKIISGVLSK